MKMPVTPSCAVPPAQSEPVQVPAMFFASNAAPWPAMIWMGAENPAGKLKELMPPKSETDDAETLLAVKFTVGEPRLRVPEMNPSLNVTGVPPTTLNEKEP